MSRIGCKDRWKPRYAGIPRLRLGNNGKPWSTKISSLIFVPHGFPFFQAIPYSSSLFFRAICVFPIGEPVSKCFSFKYPSVKFKRTI